MAMRTLERHHVIRAPFHRPSQFVDGPMMSTAQGDEIREIGLAAPYPVDHVVNFREINESAAGEATALVATRDLDPLGHRGASASAFLIEDGPIAALDREHDFGVARESPGYLRRDRAHARQLGDAIGM
jgi:hypothetical protein